jgi:cytochrome P450
MSLVYNPHSKELMADPFPVYQQLRDDHPAYYNRDLDLWVLSRYQDVNAALNDVETYSSANSIALGAPSEMMAQTPMMIMMDPPRHTELRLLVSRAFTPRRVAELEPRIREIAVELIDDCIATGSGDIVDAFSGPLPTTVIGEMLGVPIEDRKWFKDRSNAMLNQNAGEIRARGGEPDFTPVLELLGYLADVYKQRRAEPRDDLMSALLAAEIDGKRLEEPELLGFALLLLIAGNETTTNLISNALDLLDRHPEQRDKLAKNPDLIPDAIEEILRYESPVIGLGRLLERDVHLHGQSLKKGQNVQLLYASANRDERWLADADTFDITRKPTRHLAFGFGTHFCLGASLARLEGRVALEELLARMPEFSVDRNNGVRTSSTAIRGWLQLPVSITTRR